MTNARISWVIALFFATVTAFAAGAAVASPDTGTSSFAEGRYVYAINHDSRGEIGTVVNTVRVDGDKLTIQSHESIVVKVLGVVAYRQTAARREQWQGRELVRFNGHTDQDGKVSTVTAARQGSVLQIDGSKGPHQASGVISPSNPWRIESAAASKAVDVVDGEVKPIQVTEIGAARIQVAGRTVTTRHFRITGGVKREIWYDGNGIAVQIRFFHKGDVIDMTLVQAPAMVPQNAQR